MAPANRGSHVHAEPIYILTGPDHPAKGQGSLVGFRQCEGPDQNTEPSAHTTQAGPLGWSTTWLDWHLLELLHITWTFQNIAPPIGIARDISWLIKGKSTEVREGGMRQWLSGQDLQDFPYPPGYNTDNQHQRKIVEHIKQSCWPSRGKSGRRKE